MCLHAASPWFKPLARQLFDPKYIKNKKDGTTRTPELPKGEVTYLWVIAAVAAIDGLWAELKGKTGVPCKNMAGVDTLLRHTIGLNAQLDGDEAFKIGHRCVNRMRKVREALESPHLIEFRSTADPERSWARLAARWSATCPEYQSVPALSYSSPATAGAKRPAPAAEATGYVALAAASSPLRPAPLACISNSPPKPPRPTGGKKLKPPPARHWSASFEAGFDKGAAGVIEGCEARVARQQEFHEHEIAQLQQRCLAELEAERRRYALLSAELERTQAVAASQYSDVVYLAQDQRLDLPAHLGWPDLPFDVGVLRVLGDADTSNMTYDDRMTHLEKVHAFMIDHCNSQCPPSRQLDTHMWPV